MEDIKKIQEFFSKPLEENTTDWPKEVPSRHGDIIFRLVKVMPDRAKYELIDAETGKTWEVGGRVYGTVNQLKASAEDTIKPQGGRQSSQFESVTIDEAKVDYDFSERELIRVLRQLKRGASTEIDMIKAFTKALGRDITKDELFSESIDEGNDKIKDLEQQLDFHTQMDNKGRASIIKDKIEKLRKLSNSGEIDGDEFLDKFNPLQKQLKSIDEDNSYARVSKPRFIKDKRNPNFLNVYIDYDLGPGGSSIALGKETMTGQIRRLSAAKAKMIAYDVARDLKAKYNLEDIDVQDLENGKIHIFAVSDDFINMNPNMLGESLNENLNPEVSNAVNRFIKAMAKRYDYSEQDAVYAIQAALKQRDFNSVNESIVEKVIAQLKEEKPGLWANIRAKKARGEKPAHGNSDAHKTAVKAGKKINKLNEDEEDQFAAELDGFADQLAAEIKDELEDHKEDIQKSDKELNEIVGVVGIIGYILLSNTVANMLSKFAKKQFAKRDWGKGEAAAKKIYDFTHKNEEAFKAPIRRIVGLFTKDEKKKTMISDILYAIVVLAMAGQAGGDAVGYIKKAGYIKGGLYGLKAAVKGTEVAQILKGVVADAVS